MIDLPALIVVSGPAGTGKTQLAHVLASAIGCPAICRDEIKEGMVRAQAGEYQATTGDALTKRTFPLFFDVLRVLLAGGVTVVGEAAFQDRNWRVGLAPLLPLAKLRVIQCTAAHEVARERVARRMAEPTRAAHADAEWLERTATQFDRLSLPAPTLVVDTTSGYVPELSVIATFAIS